MSTLYDADNRKLQVHTSGSGVSDLVGPGVEALQENMKVESQSRGDVVRCGAVYNILSLLFPTAHYHRKVQKDGP